MTRLVDDSYALSSSSSPTRLLAVPTCLMSSDVDLSTLNIGTSMKTWLNELDLGGYQPY